MKRLGEDLKLRLLSLFIAIILWICVINIQNPEVKRDFEDIPVSIVNMDYGLALVDHQDYSTLVKVKGKQEAVKKLSRGDIEAVADLKDFNKPGRFSVPLRFNISGEQGIEVIDSENNKIEVVLEKHIQAAKMINVEFVGDKKTDARYNVKSIRPNVVTISGPQSLIQSVESVRVLIDVSNLDKDISVIKKYKVINKKGQDITENRSLIKDNQSITVEIDYSKAKEVPINLSLIGQPAKGYFISGKIAEPSKVYIYGQPEKIDAVQQIETRNYNVSGITRSMSKQLGLVLPADIKTDFNGTVRVSIEIEKEEIKAFEVQDTDIAIINASGDYNYMILTPKIRLNLIGRDAGLGSISISGVGLSVDVAGLKEGEHRLPLIIVGNDKIRVAEGTSLVKVRVTKK